MSDSEFIVTREMVDAVAEWRDRHQREHIRPLVPMLRERFGLDNAQAIRICCDPRVMQPANSNESPRAADEVVGDHDHSHQGEFDVPGEAGGDDDAA